MNAWPYTNDIVALTATIEAGKTVFTDHTKVNAEKLMESSVAKQDGTGKIIEKMRRHFGATIHGAVDDKLSVQAPISDADGWIEYDGNGDCPVPAGTLTGYKIDGIYRNKHNSPEKCYWNGNSNGYPRITHYRIEKPTRDPSD